MVVCSEARRFFHKLLDEYQLRGKVDIISCHGVRKDENRKILIWTLFEVAESIESHLEPLVYPIFSKEFYGKIRFELQKIQKNHSEKRDMRKKINTTFKLKVAPHKLYPPEIIKIYKQHGYICRLLSN